MITPNLEQIPNLSFKITNVVPTLHTRHSPISRPQAAPSFQAVESVLFPEPLSYWMEVVFKRIIHFLLLYICLGNFISETKNA